MNLETRHFTNENKEQVLSWCTNRQQNACHSWDENGNPIIKIPKNNDLYDLLIVRFGDTIQWDGKQFTLSEPLIGSEGNN